MATIATIRLRTGPDRDLEGYLFSDEAHARQWLSQKLIREHLDEYYLERLEISAEEATCPTCRGTGCMPRRFRVLGRLSAAEFLRISELRESE